MNKKISIVQLKPGMYVSDLGSNWTSHSFLLNAFAVKDDATVRKLIDSGIKELYIDPTRGDDVADAPTLAEVIDSLERDMLELATGPAAERKVTAAEELGRARKIQSEANKVIRNIMQDARLGRQVRLEPAEQVVRKITDSILRNASALLSLMRLKNKDSYTFEHSVSVCVMQVTFCHTVGLDTDTTCLAGIGGLLHDIGKVRVPDKILNKPGRLTEEEFTLMKSHVCEGQRILADTDGIHETSILVVSQHHERQDGSGYSAGLKGEAISQMGHMAAICDVYDAITTDRVYQKGMAPHEALRKLLEWSKFHFNSSLTQAFLRTIGIYPVGALVLLESGRLGVVLEQSEGKILQPLVRVFYDGRKRCYIVPQEVDLSRPVGNGGADKIVGHEKAEKWGIDLAKFA